MLQISKDTNKCYISIGYPKEDAVVNGQYDIDFKDRIHMGRW